MKILLRYLLIFSLVFALAGAGGYLFITLFTKSAKEVVLPQLKGKNIIYVLETLTRMGLNAKLLGSQYDPAIPEYSITFQDPAPGALIKKGRDVMIYISKGREEILMPDLRQLPLGQAGLTLESVGLKPASLSFVHSPDTRKDHVIAQYPRPFTQSSKEAPCMLLVSRGPSALPMVMPDLTGSLLADAVQVLDGMNLEPDSITSRNSPNTRPGIVLSQNPISGHPVLSESKIELLASHSRQNLEMDPDNLKGVILVSTPLSPGFLKKHVRVEMTMGGLTLDLFNEYFSPGQDINILIPAGIKTIIDVFVDQKHVKHRTLDPWTREAEDLLWAESRLPSWTRLLTIGENPWD
ncbi:PASTA domain-containing protein [Desulfospira joergensenii]|uniref:PASTA domain-containing protein n=1 Tax=Desulfospira joergensenii TaxID=53329 RepID=UPI0003B724A4|nr:PASTA domain-containing protein [Desulfospira joergensenii]